MDLRGTPMAMMLFPKRFWSTLWFLEMVNAPFCISFMVNLDNMMIVIYVKMYKNVVLFSIEQNHVNLQKDVSNFWKLLWPYWYQ